MTKKMEYAGYPLFNEPEFDDNKELQTRNRGVIMTNILEDHFEDGEVKPMGYGLIFGYFNEIPLEDRVEVRAEFLKQAKERGFQHD